MCLAVADVLVRAGSKGDAGYPSVITKKLQVPQFLVADTLERLILNRRIYCFLPGSITWVQSAFPSAGRFGSAAAKAEGEPPSGWPTAARRVARRVRHSKSGQRLPPGFEGGVRPS